VGWSGAAPVLLKVAMPQPAVVLGAGQERRAVAVARLLFREGMSLGTLPPAPPDAATAWLADGDLVSGPTSASGTGLLTFSMDGLASAMDAVFAWMEEVPEPPQGACAPRCGLPTGGREPGRAFWPRPGTWHPFT